MTLSRAPLPSPEAVMATGQGLLAETMPRYDAINAGALTSGSAYFTAIPLYAGTSIAQLIVQVTAAAAGLTLCKLGIYSKTLALLAATADQSALFNGATQVVAAPLAAPFVVPSSDLYYAVILTVGVTPPTVQRSSGLNQWNVGAGARAYGVETALADLPAQAALSAGAGQAIWVGCA